MADDGASLGRVEDVSGRGMEIVVSPVGRIGLGLGCIWVGAESGCSPGIYCIYSNVSFFKREMCVS